MTFDLQKKTSTEYTRGLLLVFIAGVLWSTVGLGIRLIQDVSVWQIVLYRSFSLNALLATVIYLRSGLSPVAIVFGSNRRKRSSRCKKKTANDQLDNIK